MFHDSNIAQSNHFVKYYFASMKNIFSDGRDGEGDCSRGGTNKKSPPLPVALVTNLVHVKHYFASMKNIFASDNELRTGVMRRMRDGLLTEW